MKNEIAENLRLAASRGKTFADNADYLCPITIRQAETASDYIDFLLKHIQSARQACLDAADFIRDDYTYQSENGPEIEPHAAKIFERLIDVAFADNPKTDNNPNIQTLIAALNLILSRDEKNKDFQKILNDWLREQ